jgi:hypothetical protein
MAHWLLTATLRNHAWMIPGSLRLTRPRQAPTLDLLVPTGGNEASNGFSFRVDMPTLDGDLMATGRRRRAPADVVFMKVLE